MNKPLLIAYNVILVLAAAGALWWYQSTRSGPPELADGTPLSAFSGSYPAGWPSGLMLVQGEGVWAAQLGQTTPSGRLQQHVVGRFYYEAPDNEVLAELELLLGANYSRPGTINVEQGGVPVRGFIIHPPAATSGEPEFAHATVTVSPLVKGQLRKNPQGRIRTVVTIQRVVSQNAAQ